jgi:hypothetical protein
VVQRIEAGRHGVTVDAWDAATDTVERWQAINCIVALPVFVAARVVVNPPDFLREAAARTRYSPWLVANLHIDHAPARPARRAAELGQRALRQRRPGLCGRHAPEPAARCRAPRY